MKLETLSIHAGNNIDATTGAISMPITLSTTFERAEDGGFVEGRDIYTRSSNPNRRAVEQKIAAIEGGDVAVAFSSGQAAMMSVMHLLGAGSHIVIPNDIYYGTRALLENHYERWGVTYTEVDMSDIREIKKAIKKNTALIWIETPSNPMVKITDIQAVVKLAKTKNILTACDNTWATPYFQKPLDLDVDIVMHSTTKYFGGHSDILGGVIVVNASTTFNRIASTISGGTSTIAEKIRDFQILGGAVPSVFDCWLLFRSLSTFAIRMPIHAKNAQKLAEYLEKQPQIEEVCYPGLKSNRYHKVAKKQMVGGFGGMMSILIKGGQAEAMKLASNLRLFKHATSLGGVESLVEHRTSVEGVHSRSPENLLRISVGIEHIDDLIADFEQALSKIS